VSIVYTCNTYFVNLFKSVRSIFSYNMFIVDNLEGRMFIIEWGTIVRCEVYGVV